jgi:hypothetical protein
MSLRITYPTIHWMQIMPRPLLVPTISVLRTTRMRDKDDGICAVSRMFSDREAS